MDLIIKKIIDKGMLKFLFNGIHIAHRSDWRTDLVLEGNEDDENVKYESLTEMYLDVIPKINNDIRNDEEINNNIENVINLINKIDVGEDDFDKISNIKIDIAGNIDYIFMTRVPMFEYTFNVDYTYETYEDIIDFLIEEYNNEYVLK